MAGRSGYRRTFSIGSGSLQDRRPARSRDRSSSTKRKSHPQRLSDQVIFTAATPPEVGGERTRGGAAAGQLARLGP